MGAFTKLGAVLATAGIAAQIAGFPDAGLAVLGAAVVIVLPAAIASDLEE